MNEIFLCCFTQGNNIFRKTNTVECFIQNSEEQSYFKFTYKRPGISKLIDMNIQEPKIAKKSFPLCLLISLQVSDIRTSKISQTSIPNPKYIL